MHYRPDVDELRAIAILSIVFYHVCASWLPRGIIGVDVFSVISGYLITRIIAEEIADVAAMGMWFNAAYGFVGLALAELARTEVARGDDNPLSATCLRSQAQTWPLPVLECTIAADCFPTQWVLGGDSHADTLAPGVVTFANDLGRAARQLTMASCPPLLGVRVVGPNASFVLCAIVNEQATRDVESTPSENPVVLSAAWTVYTEGASFGIDDSGPLTYLVNDVDQEHPGATSRRVFVRALGRTIDALLAPGTMVFIIGQVPELGIYIPACLARNQLPLGGKRTCLAAAAIVLDRLRAVSTDIDAVLRSRPQTFAFHPHRAPWFGQRVSRQGTGRGDSLRRRRPLEHDGCACARGALRVPGSRRTIFR